MEETNNESIEKKLAYLNETKGLIKSAIINKGQELTDETPFRDYVQKIDDIETGVDTSDATALASDLLKGKTAYNAEGKIEGTLELKDGDVKLFETQEEMQSDPNAQEGDLAVVYRSEIQNMTSTTETASIIFPETVTLPTAFTDSTYCRLRAVDSGVMFDGNCDLSKTSFRFDGWSEFGMIRVEYTSTDGITYTRTRFQGDNGDLKNPVDLGTTVKVEQTEEWNDNLGYFMQTGGMYFEGLYENKIDTNVIQFLNLSATSFSNIDLVNKNATATLNNNDKYSLKIDKSKVLSILKANDINTGACTLFVTSNNELMYTSSLIPLYDTTGSLLGYCLNGYYSNESSEFYKINLDNNTVTQAYTKSASNHFYGSSSSDNYYYLSKDEIDCVTLPTYINSNTNTYSYDVQIVSTDSNNPLQIYIYQLNYDYQGTSTKYYLAPTQLTLNNVNELLPGKIAYGKNGVIIGDKTIYDNLDYDTLYEQLGLTIYNDIELINSTFERGKLYSLIPTNEEDENTVYYRPVKRIINSSKVLNDEICSATGITDTYRTSSNPLRCSNYNCNLYIGNTNKNVYFVVYDDDNNIINCNSIFTTNQSTYGIYSRVVVDENYYYYDTQYGTDNVIIKVNREDGTCVIKHFSVPVSVNTFLSESACTFTELNDNLVYVDANSDGKGNVLYVDKNLNVIKNISYTYPDAWASEYPSTAVVMNNCLYWTIRCNLNRLFKFDGNSVIYGNEIGTGTGIVGINNMFTDGEYIYAGWYGAAGIYKLDKDCRLVSTLDSPYNSQLYNNLYNYDFEITDYRNYSCKDAYGHKRIVKDGALQRNYVHVTGLTFITNGNLLNDLRLGNTLTGKSVMAKIQKGTHTNAYNNIVTKNTNNHIYVTSLYEETISPEEYNTALDTAYSIRDDQVE